MKIKNIAAILAMINLIIIILLISGCQSNRKLRTLTEPEGWVDSLTLFFYNHCEDVDETKPILLESSYIKIKSGKNISLGVKAHVKGFFSKGELINIDLFECVDEDGNKIDLKSEPIILKVKAQPQEVGNNNCSIWNATIQSSMTAMKGDYRCDLRVTSANSSHYISRFLFIGVQ